MLNFKNILYPIDLDSKNVSSVVKALEFAQMLNCPIHFLNSPDENIIDAINLPALIIPEN
jgi:hypothetical protein